MGWCENKSISYLNARGYNVVRLPRAGIEPLDVLGRDRSVERLGSLVEIMRGPSEVPQVVGPRDAASAIGEDSDAVDLHIGLNLLRGIFSGWDAMIDKAKLEAGFRGAKKLIFKVSDVVSYSISPMALGKYLKDATVDWSNPLVSRYFDDDGDREIYVLTEVLKSQSFSIAAIDGKGGGIEADIGLLGGAVSGNVALKPILSNSNAQLTYVGTTPITFAFRCFQVRYRAGTWQLVDVTADDGISFGDPQTLEGAILRQGGLLAISR